MKKIESLVEAIFAACFLCAPVLLMIIGIWMIYNVDPLIGLVIGLIGLWYLKFYWDEIKGWFNKKFSKKDTKKED